VESELLDDVSVESLELLDVVDDVSLESLSVLSLRWLFCLIELSTSSASANILFRKFLAASDIVALVSGLKDNL